MIETIMIVKRDGSKEPLNIDKIHFVVNEACSNLAGVSASQIEMNANLQFYNGMSTTEIQEILIKSANDLISLDSPNYQYAAARLLSYTINKQVYGKYDPIPYYDFIVSNVNKKVYHADILDKYTKEELEKLESYIHHKRDENFTYAGLRQIVDKYLVQDRSTGEIYETPQYMYMTIAATNFINYPSDTRLHYVKKFYDALSLFENNIPTPICAGLRTPVRQYASCVLVDSDDTLNSIFSSDMAIGRYTALRAGIGINVGRIRGVNSKIRGGEVSHTGIIPFLKKFEATVKSCTQNGVRGGCHQKSTLIEIVDYVIDCNKELYPNNVVTKKIPIQDAEIGMLVKSYSKTDQKIEYKKILNTFTPIVKFNDQYRFDYADGGFTVTSGKHTNLLLRNNELEYVAAKDTVIGDKIVSNNGFTEITQITVGWQSDSEQFYDIEVIDNNNFFVQGNDAIDNMYVGHNSATVHVPLWTQEIEDILVLKNNKGTEDNRVRKLDYSIQLNKTMYQRLIENKNITLFSPHDVSDLYQAFFGDPDEFAKLYEFYERKTSIKKKSIPAMDLFLTLLKEKTETGRIYIMHTDHSNTHSSFKDSIYMSNLCLAGDTKVYTLVNNHEQVLTLEELDTLFQQQATIEVLSFNLHTFRCEYQKVTNSALMNSDATVITISDNVTGRSLTCTPDHKIYTRNNGYVEASKLIETDQIVFPDQDHQSLEFNLFNPTISIINKQESMPVYDITVENNHNFFANDILVHNCQEITLPTVPLQHIDDVGKTEKRIVRVLKDDVEEYEKFKKSVGHYIYQGLTND